MKNMLKTILLITVMGLLISCGEMRLLIENSIFEKNH